MCKSQCRNIRNIKEQCNSSKIHNSSIAKSKDTEIGEIPDNEFKSLVAKMIHDIKEDSNKQMNEIKKSIQDLEKKFSKQIQENKL
jgi:hypothetical protein